MEDVAIGIQPDAGLELLDGSWKVSAYAKSEPDCKGKELETGSRDCAFSASATALSNRFA